MTFTCTVSGSPPSGTLPALKLRNAKDAIQDTKQPNGNITIKIKIIDKVYIIIEDNGGGIQTKDIQSIFEPFMSTKNTNNMGIGLFTAKTIINKICGDISVSNTQNGAIFEIVLPIKN